MICVIRPLRLPLRSAGVPALGLECTYARFLYAYGFTLCKFKLIQIRAYTSPPWPTLHPTPFAVRTRALVAFETRLQHGATRGVWSWRKEQRRVDASASASASGWRRTRRRKRHLRLTSGPLTRTLRCSSTRIGLATQIGGVCSTTASGCVARNAWRGCYGAIGFYSSGPRLSSWLASVVCRGLVAQSSTRGGSTCSRQWRTSWPRAGTRRRRWRAG